MYNENINTPFRAKIIKFRFLKKHLAIRYGEVFTGRQR